MPVFHARRVMLKGNEEEDHLKVYNIFKNVVIQQGHPLVIETSFSSPPPFVLNNTIHQALEKPIIPLWNPRKNKWKEGINATEYLEHPDMVFFLLCTLSYS